MFWLFSWIFKFCVLLTFYMTQNKDGYVNEFTKIT